MDPLEETMDESTVIVCNPNGPLRITGNIVIKDAQGRDFDLAGRTAISLCRCGLSQNKPFCDGSHRNGFNSIVEARALPPVPKP
jgi:CDGSH-type Zn-finger protein